MKTFEHNDKTTAVSRGGSYSPKSDLQNFVIVSLSLNENNNDYLRRTEASASFMFKGFTISMSTSGINHGGGRTRIAVFDKDSNLVEEKDTVEEAILFILNK